MIKKIVLAVIIAVTSNFYLCSAMQGEPIAVMPDAEKLTELFSDFGLKKFVEETNAVNRLANQRLFAGGILVAKKTMFCDYSKKLKEDTDSLPVDLLLGVTSDLFDFVIDEILKSYPEVKARLQQLRENVQKIQ